MGEAAPDTTPDRDPGATSRALREELPRAGDEIVQAAGHRLRFVTTAADSAGRLLEMEVTYAGRTTFPPLHLHPAQEETFRVLSGRLRTVIDGVERVCAAGETFTIPAGVPHTMRADADGATTFSWAVRPALRTELMFAEIWRDAAAGRGGDLLSSTALMRTYGAEFRLVRPPRWLQVPLFAVLGTVGWLLGRHARS